MNFHLVFVLHEMMFLSIAVFWSVGFHFPVFQSLEWSLKDVGIGIAAVIPPFLFCVWTSKSKLPILIRHQERMVAYLRQVFGKWSILQLLIISISAGVAEEALFRGAFQGTLSGLPGPMAGLIIASVTFGAAHLITWTYAIVVSVIGAYLGLLWIWNGNLLTPMVTHAVYDFVALVYCLRVHQKIGR